MFGRPGREKFWGLCRLALLPLEWAVKPGNEGLVTLTGVCGLRTRGRAKYGCEAAAVSSLDEVSMRRICGRALVCDWGNCCEDEEEEGDKILKQVLDEIGVDLSQQVWPCCLTFLRR